jgi:hypothetical protein
MIRDCQSSITVPIKGKSTRSIRRKRESKLEHNHAWLWNSFKYLRYLQFSEWYWEADDQSSIWGDVRVSGRWRNQDSHCWCARTWNRTGTNETDRPDEIGHVACVNWHQIALFRLVVRNDGNKAVLSSHFVSSISLQLLFEFEELRSDLTRDVRSEGCRDDFSDHSLYTFAERPKTRKSPVPRDSCLDSGIVMTIEKAIHKVLELFSFGKNRKYLLLSFSVETDPLYRMVNDINLISR